MAKRRSYAKRRAAPRAAASYYRPRKKRRTSTLNKSVRKPMQAAGVLIGGVAIPYGPAMVQSVKSMSVAPIKTAIMSKENAMQAAKYGAMGLVAGTVAGVVADKTGLKRPVNKVLRIVKGVI